ncbi:MAG: hypothetical protein SVR08_08005 [Spirochaetota bacterium]|nr:hypothetical protein [Spirochaetota bacterium]
MSQKDDELKKDGWTRQFVADEPRLSEMVETYRSIGLDVHLEPMITDEDTEEAECGECRVCFEGAPKDKYKIIYTRPKPDTED